MQGYFQNAEDAKKVVKAIEEVVDTKIEGQSKVFEVIINKDISILRSELKEDIALLRSEMKEENAKMRGDFSTALAETKAEMIKWMFIFWASQLAAMFAFLKFFK